MKYLIGIIIALTMAIPTFAETVDNYAMRKATSTFPCSMNIKTQEGTTIRVNLENTTPEWYSKDTWHMMFWVDNHNKEYRKHFTNYLRDMNKVNTAYKTINIGEEIFNLDEVFFFYVQTKEINSKSSVGFKIQSSDIRGVADAMKDNYWSIPNLIYVEDTVEAFSEFRACVLEATD